MWSKFLRLNQAQVSLAYLAPRRRRLRLLPSAPGHLLWKIHLCAWRLPMLLWNFDYPILCALQNYHGRLQHVGYTGEKPSLTWMVGMLKLCTRSTSVDDARMHDMKKMQKKFSCRSTVNSLRSNEGFVTSENSTIPLNHPTPETPVRRACFAVLGSIPSYLSIMTLHRHPWMLPFFTWFQADDW